MRRLLYGPARWFAYRTTADDRRTIGFWLGVVFVLCSIVTWTSIDHSLASHILGAITLLLLLWTIVSTETPVETED